MNFNLKLIYGHLSTQASWVRYWRGKGIVLTRQRPLFSERMGYTKSKKLPFGWRIRKLKVID